MNSTNCLNNAILFFLSSLWRWQSLYFLLLFYTQKTFHFAKLKAQISIFTYSKFRKNSTLLCVFFSLSLYRSLLLYKIYRCFCLTFQLFTNHRFLSDSVEFTHKISIFLIYSMMYRPPKIILKMKRIQYGRIGYERIHTFNWMHKITEYFLLTHQSRGQKNYDYLAITFVSVPHNQTTLHTQYVFMTTVWEESYEWREDILTQRTAHDWHGKITMQTEANEQSLSHANAFRYIKIY